MNSLRNSTNMIQVLSHNLSSGDARCRPNVLPVSLMYKPPPAALTAQSWGETYHWYVSNRDRAVGVAGSRKVNKEFTVGITALSSNPPSLIRSLSELVAHLISGHALL